MLGQSFLEPVHRHDGKTNLSGQYFKNGFLAVIHKATGWRKPTTWFKENEPSGWNIFRIHKSSGWSSLRFLWIWVFWEFRLGSTNPVVGAHYVFWEFELSYRCLNCREFHSQALKHDSEKVNWESWRQNQEVSGRYCDTDKFQKTQISMQGEWPIAKSISNIIPILVAKSKDCETIQNERSQTTCNETGVGVGMVRGWKSVCWGVLPNS